MPSKKQFEPDWVSSPGDTILDLLEERSYSEVEFAQRMGYTPKHTNELLKSRVPIAPETARKLELVLGGSADFWISREAQFRATAVATTSHGHKTNDAWLKGLPVRDMLQFGWISPKLYATNPVEACLRFFAVADVQAWQTTYRDVLHMAAFRTSATFRSQPGAVAAWLRQGEIQAATLHCQPWNAKSFHEALLNLRPLTRKRDPQKFLPELKNICASCGVAVSVVRAPSGCRASGATRFVSPTKALLLLSFRYLSDDHFWFTFFHEAGHLILHNKKAIFLEGIKTSASEEREANEFSAHVLVPTEFRAELDRLEAERHKIRNFAKMVGVSPGIIVGQLQYRGRLRPSHLNTLKARFQWADEG